MGAVISHSREIERVLMTTDAVGGVWTYAVELARALADCGVEMHLAVLGPAPSTDQLLAAKQVPSCRVHVLGGGALEWMDDPWEEVDLAGQWLLALANAISPQIVHLNDFSHAPLPWPCPTVVVAHSCVCTWWRSVKAEPAPVHYAEYRRKITAGLHAADAVVAPTNAFRRQFLSEHGLDLPVEVIPNARAASRFEPGEKKSRILSAGRLWDKGKNLALLDRIAPQIDTEVAIAGEAELANASPFAGPRLHRLGQLDERSLARELAQSAIYAAPALYEPFGLAILEAALSGCALVLSDLPTLRENWDGCARFVRPNDEEAWVAALNELSSDDTELTSLQSRARMRALALNPKKQALAYLQLYREIAAPRVAPAAATNFL